MPDPTGISMRLYLAPEADLRTFAVAPNTLKVWLRYPRSSRDIALHGYWHGLDAILATVPASQHRSWLTAGGADFIYAGAADHGAHSLSAASTEMLLRVIEQVTTHRIAAYVRQQWETEAAANGHSADLNPELLVGAVEELELYFAPLREFCAKAVVKGYGLVMALWNASQERTSTSAGAPQIGR